MTYLHQPWLSLSLICLSTYAKKIAYSDSFIWEWFPGSVNIGIEYETYVFGAFRIDDGYLCA